MTYRARRISVSFRLGKGTFGADGSTLDTVDLPNHRASITVVASTLPGFNTASLRIFGMTLELMNKVSRLGVPPLFARDNFVTVQAGDAVSGMAQIFTGVLQQSWTDFDGSPESCLFVEAHSGIIDTLKPALPSSYPGGADVAVIMADLAGKMGKRFENSGVTGRILHNPYYPGTLVDQVAACAREANINATIDGDVLAIWPKYGFRGAKIPLISPATGLVGYPAYCDTGIMFRTEFNPAIAWGGKVKIESDLKPANGEWIINALAHDLSSETPDGPWFTNMKAYRFGDPATLPG